jgi:hypothetical protein
MDRLIAGYSDVLPLNIVSSVSFTRHELSTLLTTYFVDDHMEKALSSVQTSMYSVVVSRKRLMVTSKYATSMVFLSRWLINRLMRRVCISLDWGGWFGL